jgi:hypothetical protein
MDELNQWMLEFLAMIIIMIMEYKFGFLWSKRMLALH